MSASIAADRARTSADARLVALARESRGEALELMYSAYKSRIYTFLLRLLADPVGADDLTQDVFTKAYQDLGSPPPAAGTRCRRTNAAPSRSAIRSAGSWRPCPWSNRPPFCSTRLKAIHTKR